MASQGIGISAVTAADQKGVIRVPLVGPNDILLKATGHIEPKICGGVPAPQWTFSTPTPLLTQKGLTAEVLQQELDAINAKAREDMEGVKNYMPYAPIPCLLVLIGFILLLVGFAAGFDTALVIVGFVLFAVGGCGAVGGYWFASRKTMQEMAPRTEQTKKYIEVDLNNKYQEQYGIRWGIEQETTIHTTGSGENKRVVTKTLHHIRVSPVDTGAAAQQNGNPVNPNPVQVVVVQTQNQSASPPADAPQEESAPLSTNQ